MRALLLVATAELRHRRAAMLGLVAVVTLVSAVVFAAAAGARRTSTVIDRFLDTTGAADAMVGIPQPSVASDASAVRALADELAVLDGVSGVAPVQAITGAVATEQDFALLTGPDDRYWQQFRPLVVEGRLPATDAADEVVLNEAAVEALGLGEGDSLAVPTFTVATGQALVEGRVTELVADGPVLHLDIVGVFRDHNSFNVEDAPSGVLSPAAGSRVGDAAAFGALFMLTGEPDRIDVEAARGILQAAAPGAETWAVTLEEDLAPVRRAFDSLATGLVLFALIGAAAGLIALGHATSRQVALSEPIIAIARGLGMSRHGIAAATALPSMIAVTAGAVLGSVAAVAASPLFPRSIARTAEVDPGIRIDWVVLSVGGLAVVATMATWAVCSAWRQVTANGQTRAPRSSARGAKLRPLFPPPISVGVDAVVGGAGRRGVRASTATLGAILGVGGVLAISTFVVSQREAVDDPARFGWTWDSQPDLLAEDPWPVVDALTADPRLSAVAGLFCDDVQVARRAEYGCALMVAGGSLDLTYLDGRAPTSPDEVALGRNTMASLDLELGDNVGVGAASGTERSMTVVGEVVVPEYAESGRGVVLSADGFAELADENHYQSLLLRYPDGSDPRTLEVTLSDDYPLDFSVYSYPEPPQSLSQLGRLRPTLTALAVFMGVLGVVGLVHYLLLSGRRRREEFAVLKALGFVRSQIRTICLAQAVTVAVIGVAVGVPLGYVVGRWVWIASVDQIGMVDSPTVPWPTMALVVVLALSGAAALAVAPGWLAARRSAAELLRTE